jgi:hypothetical protein
MITQAQANLFAKALISGDFAAVSSLLNQLVPQVGAFVPVTYPGSTVAWVNNTPYVVQFVITGGTVTVISLSQGGNTGETTGSWILRPGDSITVTSSVNPTTYGYTPLF